VTERGLYVYGVSGRSPGDAVRWMRGVGDAPVREVTEGELTALVSTVSLGEFGEAALRRNLEDLGWLEATARAHHSVVDTAALSAATVPFGLATVYRTEDRLREVLRARQEEFRRALGRITGRTEWGVKGYAQSRRTEEGTETAEEPAAGDRPGTSYLLRRRVRQQTEEATREEVMAFADRVDAELAGIAVAGRLHRPQDPHLSGHEGWMILNAAYLVDDERAEEFQAAVARLAALRSDVSLQLTGPWAPYSFATEEEEAWTP
jgi:Gas vesicle synthesis protein GvpL/GvpF